MRLAAIALSCLLASCTVPTQGASETQPNGSTGAPATGASPFAPEPPGPPSLRALPREVAWGATVTLLLANGLAEPLGCNLCTSALMAADGAPVRIDRVCTLELRTIESGRTATYPYELPASVGPGTYRFSTTIERMQSGTRTTLTSNEITVR